MADAVQLNIFDVRCVGLAVTNLSAQGGDRVSSKCLFYLSRCVIQICCMYDFSDLDFAFQTVAKP